MIVTQMNDIKFVVDNSRYVFINKSKLESLIKYINDFKYQHWSKDIDLKLSEKEWVLLCFIVESINFCFWQKPKWEIVYNNEKMTGSNAMFYSIIKAIENKTLKLDVEELRKLNKTKFINLFVTSKESLSMINERYENFIQTINIFSNNKNIYNDLFSIKSDIKLIKYIISNFKSFDDKSNYKGRLIHFNKRAILLVNDLFNVSATIRENIGNVNNLSGCADYGIPRTFRDFGILEYSPELADKIDNEIEIQHNSEMEIEIRANMLYSIELIKDLLLKRDIVINSVQLDNLIWWVYKKNIGKKSVAHHTTTIYY